MRFLFPLFLAGAAALLVPVLLHLARRQTRREIPFGSLMFLGPTRPRFDRRQRLEHWLLLALRCLALLLLAAAFARPFFTRPLPALAVHAASRTVVLLDVSASMQRGGLWSDALARARAALAAARSDRVSVLAYDGRPRTVITFEDWAAQPPESRLAATRLDELRPGWGSTDLGRALMAAAEAIVDDEGEGGAAPAKVVVVSDLQQGSRLDALAASDWPSRIELEWAAVPAPARSNAGMQALPDADGGGKVRVRVTNAEGTAERFRLRPDEGPAIDVTVGPGQSRVVEAPARTLVLEGDEQDFDNRLYLAPPVARPVRIVYAGAGGDDGQDAQQPLFYLRRAFPSTPSRAPEIVAAAPADLRTIDAATQLVVVTAPLPPPAQAALHAHLARGRAALLVAEGPQLAPTLAALLGADVALTEAQNRAGSEGYALLTTIDVGHPVLAPFADQRFGDFTKIRFWRHRRLDERRLPGARVLARFDDGLPAWLSVPAGAGTVFVMTSGWRPADSQLALSSKFVPLLHQILEVSAGLDSGQAQFLVGDPVMLPEGKGARRVRLPDGSTVALPEEATTFSQTERPGLYALESASGSRPFAVNVDPAESATAPLGPEALERLGLGAGHPHPQGSAPAGEAARQEAFAAGLERQQGLWRWLLVAALLVLLGESWLAPRTIRRAA